MCAVLDGCYGSTTWHSEGERTTRRLCAVSSNIKAIITIAINTKADQAMAEGAFGPPVDSSTPLKLPEQLRDILETERRICQRLKDNYDLLKEKYGSLQAEHSALRVQYNSVTQADKQQTDQRKTQMEEMAAEFREKVALVEREHGEQQHKFEQFKRAAKAELVAVYQSKVDRALDELDQMKKTNGALLVERARLLADLDTTKTQLNDERKATEAKYADLKRRTDFERTELMERVNALSSKGRERLQSDLIESHERAAALAAEADRSRAQNRTSEAQQSAVVADLERKLLAIGREKSSADLTIARLQNELDVTKQRLSFNKEELERLQEELAIALKAKTTAETQFDRQLVERNAQFASRADSLQASLVDAEKTVAEKNKQLADMSAKLREIQRERTEKNTPLRRMETVVSEQPHTDPRTVSDQTTARVDKQEAPSAKLDMKLAEIEQQHAFKLREVQWERDRLETQVIKMRQKLATLSKKAGVSVESYADLEAELKRAKLEVASSQKKLSKKMKKSFRTVESKFAIAHEELQRKGVDEMPLRMTPHFLGTSNSPEVALIVREIDEYRRQHERFAQLLQVGEQRLRDAIKGSSSTPPSALINPSLSLTQSRRKKHSKAPVSSSSTSNDLS
uniref:Centrosomal protein of 83 kDa n=1 Tax=Plectus sambesii TaxID=2011161 RepID=A0A914X5W0_9BILA